MASASSPTTPSPSSSKQAATPPRTPPPPPSASSASRPSPPIPFTLLGWNVPDIEAAVATLTARGVVFSHFPGLDQTPEGIWTAPGPNIASPARVAWFHDPDGNFLSLSQH